MRSTRFHGYVKPFLKGHKNDYRDAEAITEAVQRPTMHFVAIKTPEQMDLFAPHRVRSRLVGQRTGVINQIRGFLIERGISVQQGVVPLWGPARFPQRERRRALAKDGELRRRPGAGLTAGWTLEMSKISKRGNKYLRTLVKQKLGFGR